MIRKAQLSSTHQSNANPLRDITQRLSQFGLQSTHPFNDGFIFSQNTGAPGPVSALWTPYESNLDYYESIVTSDLYIVDNKDGIVTEPMARGILYAMLQRKPIVFARKPTFARGVGAYVRSLIGRNEAQFLTLNIFAEGEETVAQRQLASLPTTVTYTFRSHDRAVIEAILRRHFRDLLTKNKREETPKQHSLAGSIA